VASSRHTGSIARRHQSKAPACCRPRACTRQLAGALPIWSGVGRPDQFEAHSGTRPRPRPPHRVEGAARLAARLRGKEVRSNLGIKIDLGRAALRTSCAHPAWLAPVHGGEEGARRHIALQHPSPARPTRATPSHAARPPATPPPSPTPRLMPHPSSPQPPPPTPPPRREHLGSAARPRKRPKQEWLFAGV